MASLFQLFVLTSIVLPLSMAAAADETARPNILWIIAEDMGPELACYGTPEVRTPVLDALAERSMLYRRAYTVTPVCSTSRSSFMTGMYAMSINAQNHRSHRQGETNPLPEGVRVLTDWLRPAGYFTANVKELTTDAEQAKFFRGTGKTDWNFNYPSDREPFDGEKFSELKNNQPFYAQVNFSETHRGDRGWNNSHKHIDTIADPANVLVPPYYPDRPYTRAIWAQYYNSVMAVDKKVGFILDLLKRDGLDKNTVIVFLGDHGRAMPRGKQFPYESGLQVPLIVHWPEGNEAFPEPVGYERGTKTDQLVASIDLSASTLDWAGVAKPEKMQGRILYGANAEPKRTHIFAGRDRGDETVLYGRTVRSDQYRYLKNGYPERPLFQLNRYKENAYPTIWFMRYLDALGQLEGPAKDLLAVKRPAEELYDLKADPYEVNNLADDPAYADVKADLAARLAAWQDEINDHGRTPEDTEITDYWESFSAGKQASRPERDKAWALAHPSLGPYEVELQEPTADTRDQIQHITAAKTVLKRLNKIELTDDQRNEFDTLSIALRIGLIQLRDEYGITKDLIKKRDEVFRSLGRPKQDESFWPVLQEKAGLTDRQLEGFQLTRERVNAFRKSVNALLTDEQSAQRRAGKKSQSPE